MGNGFSTPAPSEREQVLRNEICTYASMLYPPPNGPFSILISGAPDYNREAHFQVHRYSVDSEKPSLYTRACSVRLMRIEPRARPPTTSTVHIEGGLDCKPSQCGTCGKLQINKSLGEAKPERIEFDRQVTLLEMRSQYSADHGGDMTRVPTWAKEKLLEELLQEIEAKMLDVFGTGYSKLILESINNTKDPKDKNECADDEGLQTEHDERDGSISSSTPPSTSSSAPDALYDHEEIEDVVLL